MCLKGIGTNSISCVVPVGSTRNAVVDRQMAGVRVGREEFEVVPSFCYLGDGLSSDAGCANFYELLSVIISRSFFIISRGKVYNSCTRSPTLHASETWAQTWYDFHRCNAMTTEYADVWMCNNKKEEVNSQNPGEDAEWWFGKLLCSRRRIWHGQVERSDGWLKKVQNFNPTGCRGRGCPKETCTDVFGMELPSAGSENHPSDRKAWSSRIRSSVRLDPLTR